MSRCFASVVFALAVVACGPPENPDNLVDGGDTGTCTGAETRCSGNIYQTCSEGQFVDAETCTNACSESLGGCVDCVPEQGTVCQGDSVHACNADGTIGVQVDSCPEGTCSNGSCVDDGCIAAAELVYVVDQNYRLLSFDPRRLDMGQDPFQLIGSLNCPAGAPWPSWGAGPATPFSMSVDRDARAWVLYTSGEIFHVSTENASCQSSGFAPGQLGFELFGMGFVSDSPGSTSERLFITGGLADNGSLDIGDLGFIDKNSLQVTRVGSLPGGETYSPELTGTGDAELYGFYPGDHIAQIDKNNASHVGTLPVPPLSTVTAWAFAHWGGNFYIFVTEADLFGFEYNMVQFVDGETGQYSTPLTDHAYKIVGAGVSTCAPIIIE